MRKNHKKNVNPKNLMANLAKCLCAAALMACCALATATCFAAEPSDVLETQKKKIHILHIEYRDSDGNVLSGYTPAYTDDALEARDVSKWLVLDALRCVVEQMCSRISSTYSTVSGEVNAAYSEEVNLKPVVFAGQDDCLTTGAGGTIDLIVMDDNYGKVFGGNPPALKSFVGGSPLGVMGLE